MKTPILLFACLLSINLHAQRVDINIGFPIPSNSLKGIVSTTVQYNIGLKKEYNYIGIGGTVMLLESPQGKQVLNYSIDLGLNKEIAFSASTNIIPYFNAGYSRYHYSKELNAGPKAELGLNICNTSIAYWTGFSIAYRRHFMKDFLFTNSNNNSLVGGRFGMLILGVHFQIH